MRWVAGIRRFLVSVGVVGASCLGLSQDTIDISYPPTLATGAVLTLLEYQGLGGANSMPNIATYGTSVAAPGTGYSVIWEIKKTHAYNRISGSLYALGSPLGVVSLSHGWAGGTRTIEFQAPFWSWFGSRTVDDDRYGQFVLNLQYRPTSGSYTSVDVITWKIRPQDWNKGSGLSNGSGSGVGGQDSTVEGQNSFWSNLFVPSEGSMDALDDSIDGLLGWGPFGILSGRSIPEGSYGAGHFDSEYKVAINIGGGGTAAAGVGYGAAGTYYLDLGPYEDVVVFLRYIILAVLYFVFMSRMWSSIGRLMGLSGGVISGMGHFGETYNDSGGGGGGGSGGSRGRDQVKSALGDLMSTIDRANRRQK